MRSRIFCLWRRGQEEMGTSWRAVPLSRRRQAKAIEDDRGGAWSTSELNRIALRVYDEPGAAPLQCGVQLCVIGRASRSNRPLGRSQAERNELTGSGCSQNTAYFSTSRSVLHVWFTPIEIAIHPGPKARISRSIHSGSEEKSRASRTGRIRVSCPAGRSAPEKWAAPQRIPILQSGLGLMNWIFEGIYGI